MEIVTYIFNNLNQNIIVCLLILAICLVFLKMIESYHNTVLRLIDLIKKRHNLDIDNE